MKITPYMFKYSVEDDQILESFETKDDLFYNVSKFKAFYDCMPECRLLEIWCEGEKCHYCGWEPGMVMRYKNEKNEEVWCDSFPQWDH